MVEEVASPQGLSMSGAVLGLLGTLLGFLLKAWLDERSESHKHKQEMARRLFDKRLEVAIDLSHINHVAALNHFARLRSLELLCEADPSAEMVLASVTEQRRLEAEMQQNVQHQTRVFNTARLLFEPSVVRLGDTSGTDLLREWSEVSAGIRRTYGKLGPAPDDAASDVAKVEYVSRAVNMRREIGEKLPKLKEMISDQIAKADAVTASLRSALDPKV